MSSHIDRQSIFVILPAYNEHRIIRSVVEEITREGYQVVVVDDGSQTSLSDELFTTGAWYLRHSVNLGQGAALQTGICFALSKEASCLITYDADGQHDVRDIKILTERLYSEDLDIVFGSRFLPGSAHNMPFSRKIFLQLARFLNLFFTGLLLTDAHNGLRAIRRDAAEKIRIRENGMAHASEILQQVQLLKLRYCEVPVHISYTTYSQEKGQSIWSGFRIVFDILLSKIFR